MPDSFTSGNVKMTGLSTLAAKPPPGVVGRDEGGAHYREDRPDCLNPAGPIGTRQVGQKAKLVHRLAI